MGRTTESRIRDQQQLYRHERDYDVIGRPYRVSNPYRPWNSERRSGTPWPRRLRPNRVRNHAGQRRVTTAIMATRTATDQASKSRKSATDALGRLTTVYEDPAVRTTRPTYV